MKRPSLKPTAEILATTSLTLKSLQGFLSLRLHSLFQAGPPARFETTNDRITNTSVVRLDQLVGETVFVPLHDRYVESSDFPDLHEVYRALGVELKRDKVRLDDGAPLAKLREAIMTGKMEQLAHENSPTISHAP